jgi:hypothetical protein
MTQSALRQFLAAPHDERQQMAEMMAWRAEPELMYSR